MTQAAIRSKVRAAPMVVLPDPPAPPAPIGLIAAGGRLPMLVAEGVRAQGHTLMGLGLAGQYPGELPALCDAFEEIGVLRVAGWAKRLRRMGARHAVMVGQIDKAGLLYNWSAVLRSIPDFQTVRVIVGLRGDLRSHRLLAAVAEELSRGGVELIDSTTHIGDHMATLGTMTNTKPSALQRSDIDFGWPVLQELLRLDIGQAIAVRHSDIIAVEAIEGTDRMIERAGQLCKDGGWVLLKSSRAGHDRRADVPTIGPKTIENLHAAGGRCLALGEDDVIMVDKTQTIELADKLGIAILGIPAV